MNVMIWTPQVVTRMNWQSLCGSPYMILRSIQTIKLKGTSIKIPIHFIIKFNPSNDNSIWNSTAGTPKSFEFQIPFFDFKKKRVTKKKNIPKKTLIGALLCPHQKKTCSWVHDPKKSGIFHDQKKSGHKMFAKTSKNQGTAVRAGHLHWSLIEDRIIFCLQSSHRDPDPVVTENPTDRRSHGSLGKNFRKNGPNRLGYVGFLMLFFWFCRVI